MVDKAEGKPVIKMKILSELVPMNKFVKYRCIYSARRQYINTDRSIQNIMIEGVKYM
jgi:hypothetical protein